MYSQGIHYGSKFKELEYSFRELLNGLISHGKQEKRHIKVYNTILIMDQI